MKKGFLHVAEVVIVILLVFLMMFQFIRIPKMNIQWDKPKLILMAHDLLYSMDNSGTNIFDAEAVRAKVAGILPNNTGFTLHTIQDVKPVIRVGCVCNQSDFDVLQQEVLTDFDLNGIRRSFKLMRIDPDHIKFSLANDVIIFWGHPNIDDGSNEEKSLKRYLARERGVVQFSNLDEAMTQKRWHQDVFNLEWSDSPYTPDGNADFQPFLPIERGHKIKKVFYHAPHELSPEPSLVGYWRMNYGIGDTAWDTGYQRTNYGELLDADHSNGDGNQTATRVRGKYGLALLFDGDDDYIKVSHHNSLNVDTGSFSVEAWVKVQASSGRGRVINKVNASSGHGWLLDINTRSGGDYEAGAVRVKLDDGADVVDYWVTGGINNGRWHLITAVVDREDPSDEKLRIYVDADLKGERGISDIDFLDTGSEINLFIGGLPTHSSRPNYFDGTLDEVMFYKKALSINEIRDHHKRILPPTLGFENFVSEGVYPIDGLVSKIIVTQESVYTGGTHDGNRVPLAVINWGVEGNGRSAWMSGAGLAPANKQLLKSLVIWTVAGNEFRVVEENLKDSVKASMRKVLNQDMYEPVKIDLYLGYYY